MPSTSPGQHASSTFTHILPGRPTTCLQSLDTFIFRHKRYVVYISGRQVNLLSSPTTLAQALTFQDNLIAVAAENQTGKIVVASKRQVYVLEPLTEGWMRVWWERTLYLVREDAGDETQSMSWGSEGEVLIGGSRLLSLFSTLPSSRTSSPASAPGDGENVEERRILWSKDVPSAVKYASFSPSAGIIATTGVYDRLVKIWRRLSFEEGLFDYTYLRHQGIVTHLEWRALDEAEDDPDEIGTSGRYDDDPEILYTIATDGLLRIWRTGGIHDLDILVLHTSIDLNSAIPSSPSLSVNGAHPKANEARYAFTLRSSQITTAISAIIGLHSEKLSHSLEHLKEVSSRDPDVIIALDGHGRMSAWGLQSIGHKRRPETPSGFSKQPFHIAHAEHLPLKMSDGSHAKLRAWFEDSKFNIIVHGFDGYVQWWRDDVQSFFSPSVAGSETLREASFWTGHENSPVAILQGSDSGKNLVSCSLGKHVAYWTMDACLPDLHRAITFETVESILDAALLTVDAGQIDFIATLEQSTSDTCELRLALRTTDGRALDSQSYTFEIRDDAATWSLDQCNDGEKAVFTGLSSNGRGFVCALDLRSTNPPALEKLRQFSLPGSETGSILVHAAVVLDASDLDRVGFVCVDKVGAILLYHAELEGDEVVEPMFMGSYETNMPNSTILVTSNEFAAVTSSNGAELAIVNLRDGYVEHRAAMSGRIRHIVPCPKHNLVAVVYDAEVNILMQGRYEHRVEQPNWKLVKRVSIAGLGLSISALAWLGDGSLAIAAGNGIFFSSGDVPVQELDQDLRETIDVGIGSGKSFGLSSLSRWVRKPLPVWHPSLVAHAVRHGHWNIASKLVHALSSKLKFWSEGDDLHPLLDLPAEDLYRGDITLEDNVLDQDLVSDVLQQLGEKDLPEVSLTEQEHLKAIVKAMAYCSEHVGGLDKAAARFLFSWKIRLLEMSNITSANGTQTDRSPRSATTAAVPQMHWREIAFAFHSTTQQPLLDLIIAHYDNKITWPIAQRLGMFAWLSDRQALEQLFEALAQSAYRATSPADPINASLYFLALHKKAALLALWRIATWHKEQRATMNFLRRDFTQADNQTAAKKNAYALMGKKRFDYAAAFFLLANDAPSACSLLASQCDDIMLAIAVARLYSGDGSSVLRTLLVERLMPQAKKDGDRWLMSWCHSIMHEHHQAADALVKPLEGVRTWHQDDPNTLTLYKQLRKSENEYEYEAVLRAARILRRMGLWLVALELVSQWDFKESTPPHVLAHRQHEMPMNGVKEEKAASEPPSMLDGFANQPTVTKEPPSLLDGFSAPESTPDNDKAAREAKAAELLKKIKAKKEAAQPVLNEKKPPPTQFKEPDANSLLENFGF